jgi:hypothetical protein
MRLINLFNIIAACAAGFLGGALASRASVQASSPDVVRASRFELLDAAGRPVARWEIDPRTNSVHLCFMAKGGGVGLDAGVLSDARPFLSMKGRDGKNRISMGLDERDKPGLSMSDERWLGRIVLGHAGSDTPDIPDSTDRWGLQFRPFGTELPVAMMGMIKEGDSGTKGLLFVNGERIR